MLRMTQVEQTDHAQSPMMSAAYVQNAGRLVNTNHPSARPRGTAKKYERKYKARRKAQMRKSR